MTGWRPDPATSSIVGIFDSITRRDVAAAAARPRRAGGRTKGFRHDDDDGRREDVTGRRTRSHGTGHVRPSTGTVQLGDAHSPRFLHHDARVHRRTRWWHRARANRCDRLERVRGRPRPSIDERLYPVLSRYLDGVPKATARLRKVWAGRDGIFVHPSPPPNRCRGEDGQSHRSRQGGSGRKESPMIRSEIISPRRRDVLKMAAHFSLGVALPAWAQRSPDHGPGESPAARTQKEGPPWRFRFARTGTSRHW
jgi:hypothetical protein